jgi:hypothetical protein
MLKSIKRAALLPALAAGTVFLAPVAGARDNYYRHSDDTAAVAIGAGIIGVALGAAIASSNHGHYHGGYYYGPPHAYYYGPPRAYYYRTYPRAYYYRAYPRTYYYPSYARGYYYGPPPGHYYGYHGAAWHGHGHH